MPPPWSEQLCAAVWKEWNFQQSYVYWNGRYADKHGHLELMCIPSSQTRYRWVVCIWRRIVTCISYNPLYGGQGSEKGPSAFFFQVFKLFHIQRDTYVLYNFRLTHWKIACPSWSYRVLNFLLRVHFYCTRGLWCSFLEICIICARSLWAASTPYSKYKNKLFFKCGTVTSPLVAWWGLSFTRSTAAFIDSSATSATTYWYSLFR